MLCTDVSGKPTTSFCCLVCSWPVPIVGYQPHYSYTSQELINWRTLSSNVEIMRGVLAVDGDLWCPAWYQISVQAATGGGGLLLMYCLGWRFRAHAIIPISSRRAYLPATFTAFSPSQTVLYSAKQ